MTSSPWSRIRPAVGSSNPAIIRSVVVLPEPDGPSIEKNSPSRTSRSTPSTADDIAEPLVDTVEADGDRRSRPRPDRCRWGLGEARWSRRRSSRPGAVTDETRRCPRRPHLPGRSRGAAHAADRTGRCQAARRPSRPAPRVHGVPTSSRGDSRIVARCTPSPGGRPRPPRSARSSRPWPSSSPPATPPRPGRPRRSSPGPPSPRARSTSSPRLRVRAPGRRPGAGRDRPAPRGQRRTRHPRGDHRRPRRPGRVGGRRGASRRPAARPDADGERAAGLAGRRVGRAPASASTSPGPSPPTPRPPRGAGSSAATSRATGQGHGRAGPVRGEGAHAGARARPDERGRW